MVAASGFVSVVFNHRLRHNCPHLERAGSDLQDAINYIRENADSLNIDKDKIALVGFDDSTALLAIAMRENLSYIRCLSTFYSLLNVHNQFDSFWMETDKTKSEYSLVKQIKNTTPPFLIVRAGKDDEFYLKNIDDFAKESQSKGVKIEVANYQEATPGFDINKVDEKTKEIIQNWLEFFGKIS